MNSFRIKSIVDNSYVISSNENKYITFTNDKTVECTIFDEPDAIKLFDKLNKLDQYRDKIVMEEVKEND